MRLHNCSDLIDNDTFCVFPVSSLPLTFKVFRQWEVARKNDNLDEKCLKFPYNFFRLLKVRMMKLYVVTSPVFRGNDALMSCYSFRGRWSFGVRFSTMSIYANAMRAVGLSIEENLYWKCLKRRGNALRISNKPAWVLNKCGRVLNRSWRALRCLKMSY